MATLKNFIEIMGESMITAKVKDIKKDTARSGKTFYRVTLENGDVLFSWSYDFIRPIKKGEMAEFDVEKSQKGNFINIIGSRLATSTEIDSVDEEDIPDDEEFDESFDDEPVKKTPSLPTYSKTSTDDKMTKEDWAEKDRRICRESVLKSAIEYAAACDPDGVELTEEEILSIAKRFEEYVYSGE